MKTVHVSCIIIASLVFAGTSHAAVSVAKEGKSDIIICWSGAQHVIAAVKGQLGASYEGLGTAVMKEGDLFSNTSSTVAGAYILIGDELSEAGSWSSTDADGDLFFGRYMRNSTKEAGTWKVTGGTGKYEGMQATGTFLPISQPSAPAGFFQSCNKTTGAWKLR
jgi:hypothetical protein